jgi:HEAT repeat protein
LCVLPASASAEEDPIAPRIAVLKDKTKTSEERARAATELGGFGQAAVAAVPVLVDLLDEHDPELRDKVVGAIRTIGPAAVASLTDAFRGGNERRKIASARALALIGAEARPAVPCLAAGLAPDQPTTVRLAVVRALGSIPDDRSVKALADEVLNDPDFAVRRNAVVALSCLGPKAEAALDPLLDLLRVVNELAKQKKPLPEVSKESSPEPPPSRFDLKVTILAAVTAIGTNKVSRIAKLLEDPEPVLRGDALDVLAHMGEKAAPAVPAMAACLKDPDADMRSSAASALGALRCHGKAAVPALEKCFRDTSAEVRVTAAGACLRIDPKHSTAMTVLLQGLKDPDWSIRVEAVQQVHLSRVMSEQVVKAVSASCADKNAEVRLAAVECLGKMVASLPLALPAIEAALEDKSAAVRGAAVVAVANAGDVSRVLPALIRALEDPDGGVRYLAACMLGGQGPATASAIPALTKHLKDEEKCVREAAGRALERIREDLKSLEKDKGKAKKQ